MVGSVGTFLHIYLYCHRSKLGFIFLLYNYDYRACIIYLLYVFEQVRRKLKCNSFKVVTKNAFVTFKIKYLQHNKIVEKIIYNIIQINPFSYCLILKTFIFDTFHVLSLAQNVLLNILNFRYKHALLIS